jgi:uncharacterized Rmd1/YagE family protein
MNSFKSIEPKCFIDIAKDDNILNNMHSHELDMLNESVAEECMTKNHVLFFFLLFLPVAVVILTLTR